MDILKKNIFLIIGLLLPVILLVILLFINQTANEDIPPPKYNFIYATGLYKTSPFKYDVQGHKIILTYELNENNIKYAERTRPKLYLYDVKKRTSQEIDYKLKSDLKVDTKYTQEIYNAKPQNLDNSKISKDGYQLETSCRSGGFVFEVLFRNDCSRALTKQGQRKKIDIQYNAKHLAWIIPKGGQ